MPFDQLTARQSFLLSVDGTCNRYGPTAGLFGSEAVVKTRVGPSQNGSSGGLARYIQADIPLCVLCIKWSCSEVLTKTEIETLLLPPAVIYRSS